MRNLLLVAVVALVWTVAGESPASAAPGETAAGQKPASGAPFVHAVVFYLKKDVADGTADAMVADAREMLGKIPTVRELRVGKPPEKGTDIAKRDFQVGLVIFFDDDAGLKTYLDHPLHKKYVEKYLKHLDESKLSVYDFVDHKK